MWLFKRRERKNWAGIAGVRPAVRMTPAAEWAWEKLGFAADAVQARVLGAQSVMSL